MKNKPSPYVNDILRGIQEALGTEARGQDLIEVAQEAADALASARKFRFIQRGGLVE